MVVLAATSVPEDIVVARGAQSVLIIQTREGEAS